MGRGDQLLGALGPRVQRHAPVGELADRPGDPLDRAEELDPGAPGEELLGQGEAADQMADAAGRPGVAAHPDAYRAQDSSSRFCRTEAFRARSAG
ncbi:hypothetical protein JD77_04255 [Micromonospora olivasterospora]|uniref:Uncharacterized protein n=1 Tax=Micromonospora olivasterospora TaxID=1880 RepID=A0A562IE10_MICOL|nr:hypothetical protein JD77_04255 [Micromonospora olivasterospora]